MDMKSERVIQNIVRSCRPTLTSKRLPVKHLKAIDAIADCRTPEYGVSVYECEDDQSLQYINHSCKHRSCALCASKRRNEWINKQQQRLLDCPHFHCVFTLPSEFHVLWRFNQKWFTSTFFKVVKSVLFDLMKDPKLQGVTPGVLMAMHTWGRQLNLHPHIHCIVTAGGLDQRDQWKDSGKFMLPARVVRKLYKGRFSAEISAALENGELQLPPDHTLGYAKNLLRRTSRKVWCIKIEQQYAHGKGVLLYLSRYLRGGPVSPKQIVRCDHEKIGFRYKDHRDQRIKVLNVKPSEFVRRLMLHIPETGQHMVRHYGLYASAARRRRNYCRERIGGLMESVGITDAVSESTALICQGCGAEMRLRASFHGRLRKGNSYIYANTSRHVQQNDEPDKTQIKKIPPPLRL